MSFTEKVDVLDLLINIIKEHEEKLDEYVERLEKLAQLAHIPKREMEGQNKPVPSIIFARTENEQKIIEYLIKETYAVSERIIEKTGIPSASFYYSIKQLRKRDIIGIVGTVSRKVGGPAVKIWALNPDKHYIQ